MDSEDDPPFDDGESPPGDGEAWFDDDERVSEGDTQVHPRVESDDDDDDGEEEEGDPFAAAHSLSAGNEGSSGDEEAPEEPAADGEEEEPAADREEEQAAADGEAEPAEIEPLTPENIARMLHERAPFFEDPHAPPTDAELDAVEGEETLPAAAGEPAAYSTAAHWTEETRVRRAQERATRRREGQRRLLMLVGALVVLIIVIVLATGGGSSSPTTASTAGGSRAAHGGTGPSFLSVSTDLASVTQNVLIADRNNSRIISISPKGQVVWTHRVSAPSDAYLSYTGHTAVITQHTKSRIFTLEVDPGRVNFIYGHAGKPGSAANYLRDPQTAQEMPIGGDIVIADLGNCRILFVRLNTHHPVKTLGGGATNCVHHVLSTPYTFSKPDAAFPAGNGDLVVTELSPAWVDVFDKSLKLLDQIKLSDAGFTAPYDANEYAPGDLVVVNRSTPGVVEEFTVTGTPLWRYDVSSGAGALDRPTLARVLPNGNVLVADSGNDRIVVIDRASKKIVWQYGHTRVPGAGAGYLHTPDSVTLVPRS